jgi:hypothetical protein
MVYIYGHINMAVKYIWEHCIFGDEINNRAISRTTRVKIETKMPYEILAFGKVRTAASL